MGRACWKAAGNGKYWIDIALGNQVLPWMLDLGLVDSQHWVGFEFEPPLFDRLKLAGQMVLAGRQKRRDASGRTVHQECGLTSAQLIDPLSRQGVGPKVAIKVSRGFPGIPSRVGVVFFHRLVGCQVVWDLDNRVWCVEYP
jgi:hypothetical protein